MNTQIHRRPETRIYLLVMLLSTQALATEETSWLCQPTNNVQIYRGETIEWEFPPFTMIVKPDKVSFSHFFANRQKSNPASNEFKIIDDNSILEFLNGRFSYATISGYDRIHSIRALCAQIN